MNNKNDLNENDINENDLNENNLNENDLNKNDLNENDLNKIDLNENDFKTYRHKAQYYETDQMKVVHHSNYIRWFEEARTDMLEQAGYGYGHMEEDGISIPVLGVSCEYKSMVRYGDAVDIISKIEFFNGVRMTLSYKVTDSVTGKLKASGETKHCFIGRDGRPISLMKNNRAIYDVFLKLKAASDNV